MSAPIVSLASVSLVYPIYSMKAQSIRNSLISMTVGGRLLRDGHDIIHVSALEKVTFDLFEGDRMGVVGKNGAGKTTLLKVIGGIYEPSQGVVNVNGRIASMIDAGLGLDHNFTGRENIVNMGRMRGLSIRLIREKMEEIIEFSELGGYIDLPVKAYSSGMQARLVFSVATSLDPDILLMDEWLSTADHGFVDRAKSRMNSLLSKSRLMVLASHDFGLIKSTCNKLLVLNEGKAEYFGALEGYNL